MFVDNRQYVGHLVNSESFNTERLNGDMYEIFSNEYVSVINNDGWVYFFFPNYWFIFIASTVT